MAEEFKSKKTFQKIDFSSKRGKSKKLTDKKVKKLKVKAKELKISTLFIKGLMKFSKVELQREAKIFGVIIKINSKSKKEMALELAIKLKMKNLLDI